MSTTLQADIPVEMDSSDVAEVPPLSEILKMLLELTAATNEQPLRFVKLKCNCLRLATLTHQRDAALLRGGDGGNGASSTWRIWWRLYPS